MFGGTWTQIKDKFILAAGDSYYNGATGGAATVTLTVSNIPSHSHSFTPSGTVGSHTHTGPSHTHSFTPSGTVSSSFSGTAGTTGNQSANPTFSGSHTHSHFCLAGSSYLTYYNDQKNGIVGTNVHKSSGQTDETGYITTDEKTVIISGTTSGNHTHSFTPSGTVSSSFTGTAGNTGAAGTGNTGETAPSFSGTAGTTSSSGSGSSFSILPPYVVKYCWERTA